MPTDRRRTAGALVVLPLLVALGGCERDGLSVMKSPPVPCQPPTARIDLPTGPATEALVSPDGCRVLYRDGAGMLHDRSLAGDDDLLLGDGRPPFEPMWSPVISPMGTWVSLCTDHCFVHRFGAASLALEPHAAPLWRTHFALDEQTVHLIIANSPIALIPNAATYHGPLDGPIPSGERVAGARLAALRGGAGGLLRAGADNPGSPRRLELLQRNTRSVLADGLAWARPSSSGAWVGRTDGTDAVAVEFITPGERRSIARGRFYEPVCEESDIGTGQSMSPGGERLLLVEEHQGNLVAVVLANDGTRVTLAGAPRSTLGCGFFSDDGSRLLYRLDDERVVVHDFRAPADRADHILASGWSQGLLAGRISGDGRYVVGGDGSVLRVDDGGVLRPPSTKINGVRYAIARGNRLPWDERRPDGNLGMVILDASHDRVLEDPLETDPASLLPGVLQVVGGGPDSVVYLVREPGRTGLTLRAFRGADADFVTLATDVLAPIDRYDEADRGFLAVATLGGTVAVIPLP